jgi:hypothetical protein
MITDYIDYLGWIATGILLIAYSTLLTKWKKWFIPVNAFASFLLVDYAILTKDYPFVVVNGLVFIILFIKLYKGEILE